MHSNRRPEDLHIRCEILHAFCVQSRLEFSFSQLHSASTADASLRVIACSCQSNTTLEVVRTIIFLLYFAVFVGFFFMATLNLAWVRCQGYNSPQTNLISFWCGVSWRNERWQTVCVEEWQLKGSSICCGDIFLLLSFRECERERWVWVMWGGGVMLGGGGGSRGMHKQQLQIRLTLSQLCVWGWQRCWTQSV